MVLGICRVLLAVGEGHTRTLISPQNDEQLNPAAAFVCVGLPDGGQICCALHLCM